MRIDIDGAYTTLIGKGRGNLSVEDRRVVTNIVNGVVRLKRRLDFYIDELHAGYFERLGKEAPPMDIKVRQILRIAAFELVVNGKPSHATTAFVDMTKRIPKMAWATGMVNNMVRKIANETPELPACDEDAVPNDAVVKSLGTRHSHPDWIVARWLDRFGRSACVELLEANNSLGEHHLKYSVRSNHPSFTFDDLRRFCIDADITCEPSAWLPNEFFEVSKGLSSLVKSGLLDGGSVSVQDVSSGLVVTLLDPQPQERILDTCAAPGGKLFHAASKMRYEGEIVALDRNEGRMQALHRRAKNATSGLPDTLDLRTFGGMDLASWSRKNEGVVFDRVLLDAPCTGTGVLLKRPDLRWRRTEQDLQELTEIQRTLLSEAAKHVAVGGCLVYSTCSVEREENFGQVERFLASHAHFEHDVDAATRLLPDALCSEGCLQSFPHVHGIDGAFAARFRRTR